jgi:Ras-related protein Rab-7A
MAFCHSKGDIPYFETSAKEAINVEQAFEGMYRATRVFPYLTVFVVIARQALAQEDAADFNSDFPEAITIRPESPSNPCAC